MREAEEKREFLRAEVNVFVNENIASNAHLARVVDISEGGMRYIKPAGPVERCGPNVFLEFCLPDDELPVRALGRVVGDDLERSTHATSICFTAIDSGDADRIRRYVIRRKRAELFAMLRRDHAGAMSA